MAEQKSIVAKNKNFSKWYNQVILKAKLADYSPVKGCMVIRPYGYAIWENIRNALDEMIKKAGVKNAYFPLFIPESFLQKEAEHVEGFSPELAMVTIGGGKELAERLVIRPTSETIMYSMFAKWIQSWRDLPLMINQWANIVRWEKRTYLFLRTTEFLWQEGHTVHRYHHQAKKEVERALKMYIKLCCQWLAMPGYAGKKAQTDKFPGAVNTFAYESLMPDGKALQSCTSHDLGQNFAKVFDIQFQDEEGELKYGWQTSWGLTTRIIGGLVMMHGDNQGLVLPPKIAPVKAAIIPVQGDKDQEINEFGRKLKTKIETSKSGFPGVVEFWDSTNHTFGWKTNEAELKGIPLVIPLGPKELKEERIEIKRRDGKKTEKISLGNTTDSIEEFLDRIQSNLWQKAEKFLKENTYQVDDYQRFKKVMKNQRGFIKAYWCESPECEEKIKEETKASTRSLPLGAKKQKGKCVYCQKEASYRWLFGQAY